MSEVVSGGKDKIHKSGGEGKKKGGKDDFFPFPLFLFRLSLSLSPSAAASERS